MPGAGFVCRFLKPCAVAAFMTVLAACGGGGGGGEPERTVTTVTVSSPTLTPKQGDTVQLTAVARDQFGEAMSGIPASWSSSAPSVATVSSTGLLQALAGGSVTATATISGVPGSLTLTITPRVTTTVTVSSPTASPTVSDTVQLTVVARDQFGDVLAGKTATLVHLGREGRHDLPDRAVAGGGARYGGGNRHDRRSAGLADADHHAAGDDHGHGQQSDRQPDGG